MLQKLPHDAGHGDMVRLAWHAGHQAADAPDDQVHPHSCLGGLRQLVDQLPLRDGDTERDDEAYKNSFFVNANSTTAPQIVDRSVQPILDRSEVYSGCYARVSVNFYAFNSNGNRGIACGLGNIQKVRDGEPLGGKSSAADDFATDLDDDFLS